MTNCEEKLNIIIWTTTPWTIPCNKAIAFSKKLDYKIIEIEEDLSSLSLRSGEKLILAENLLENFLTTHSIKKFSIHNSIKVEDLEKLICEHPLKSIGYKFKVRLFDSWHVTDETGTGFVHIAPNHGIEDFEVGKKII